MPLLRWSEDIDLPAPTGSTANEQDSILSGSLTFLNRREMIGFPPDWNGNNLPMLWVYNLHYHEFLWQLGFEQARLVVLNWIDSYRLGSGRIGWDAYPTSLRLANWCALFFGRYRTETVADKRLCETLWGSLCEQADHLQRNLEWHLLGNHLLENSVALTLTGSCFEHPTSKIWFKTGYAILGRELPEQILADGGHFERSPMYHSRILYVLLLLSATGDRSLKKLVRPYLEPLANSLAAMTHPDGGIALLNDSAFRVYPKQQELARRVCSDSIRLGSFALPESGYYGARTGDGHYIICDAGVIGPDYQPAHGHADLFSFELSLLGARVVVDSGVCTYEAGPMRDYCRSTRAHNTVEIEGQNQVEVWAAFRVGRRCRPDKVNWAELEDGFELSGEHAGYRHLPGRPTHVRAFRWHHDGSLQILDQVNSHQPLRSTARLHFHPDCKICDLNRDSCRLSLPEGHLRISWAGWLTVAEDHSIYCPEFGIEIPNPCLALSNFAPNLRGMIRIELL